MRATILLVFAFLLTACGVSTGSGVVDTGSASDTVTVTDTDTASGTDTTSDAANGTDTADAVTVTETTSGTDLTVVCFAAGKADAFLLLTPESAVLIDCGVKGFGRTILAELETRGITQLDLMIITHFDQDHVGGAARIINNFPVTRILQSNSPKDSEEYEKYVKAVKTAGIEPETVRETLSFTLDGVSYTVNPPKKNKYNSDTSNNSSLIVSVENGQNRLLFTGDAEDERLEEFLSIGGWGTYDFLKMPHHGSWHEPLLLLVESTAPRYALITSSDDEPEDSETLELLESFGVETFLTRFGQVLVHSDGTQLTVEYA
ncbi:MAG: MBL fold metallo-hydrolase [Oscillospiraceae bacterium]|nr:MBL fold metallo-hydrolase [Oscillospiraceae bacterium]